MGGGHCCTCRSFLKHNAVPGGWREKLMSKFFSDSLWWWDCRLKKANEYESCHNCLVDSAIALLVVMILVWSARILRNNMADQLVVGECNFFPVSSTQDTGLTPGLGNPMGGS
jgi:hypothetical protein